MDKIKTILRDKVHVTGAVITAVMLIVGLIIGADNG